MRIVPALRPSPALYLPTTAHAKRHDGSSHAHNPAKALGIKIPQSLLISTNKVIE